MEVHDVPLLQHLIGLLVSVRLFGGSLSVIFSIGFPDLESLLQATRLAEEKEVVVKQLVAVECQLKSESMEQSDIAADLQRLKLELTRLEGENEVAKSRMDESRQELQQVNDELICFRGERMEMETSFGMKLKALEENTSVLLEEKVGLCEELAVARVELEQLREELRRVHDEKAEFEKSSAATIERLEQQVRTWELRL